MAQIIYSSLLSQRPLVKKITAAGRFYSYFYIFAVHFFQAKGFEYKTVGVISSVGLEYLPDTQGVGGSSPPSPTFHYEDFMFLLVIFAA